MKKLNKTRLTAYLFLIGNTICWSLALPIAKKGFENGLTPLLFLFSRYLIAFVLSLPILFLIRDKKQLKSVFNPTSLSKIFTLELLGTVLALYILYLGVNLTSSVESSLIAITWPVFVVIGGVAFFKEKLQKNEFKGLLLAILGTLILTIEPLFFLKINGSVQGNLLIVTQNIIIALYYLLAKKVYRYFNKWLIVIVSFFVGTFGFFTIGLFQNINLFSQFILLFQNTNPWPLLSIGYISIFGSILGATFYLLGQDKIEASEASVFTYLQPLIALPASAFLLGENISFLQIFSLIFIFIGVFLSAKR